MILCLTSGTVGAVLAIQAFTLAWTHSVEKIHWEEDWRIEGKQLRITEARVLGSGAGMEPPSDAVFRYGAWHYSPQLSPLRRIDLAHSPYTTGYEFCIDGHCRPLASFLPGIEETATIHPPCEH